MSEKEVAYLKSQRIERKLVTSYATGVAHTNFCLERFAHQKKVPAGDSGPSSSSLLTETWGAPACPPVTVYKLRWTRHSYCGLDGDSIDESKVEDYQSKDVTGSKKYMIRKSFDITTESCILADRRMTLVRQQSDSILAVVDKGNVAALPAAIYHAKEGKFA